MPCQPQTTGYSAYELSWALSHPAAAIKAKKIKDECDRFFDQKRFSTMLDSFANGGKLDAFRHVFYMAAMAREVKPSKLRPLGRAHEKSNYNQFKRGTLEFGERPDSLSGVMDLANNELGLRIGSSAKNMDYETLSLLVIKSIKNGEALIMKRNRKGNYLDCSGKEINLAQFKDKWAIPKCLVNSDFIYSD